MERSNVGSRGDRAGVAGAGDRATARARFAACATLRPNDPLRTLWQQKLEDPTFDGVFRLDHK